jgi:endonuclease/exonuclease/phosphatase family metal-dependent hydrolase
LITGSAWHSSHAGISPIRIYAQNVYVGTDVDAVITAGASSPDPTVLFGALLGALQVFDATRWSERAARIASEVRRQDPDVIGLSEVSTVSRRGLADYGVQDNSTEFLPILLEAFRQKGLRYEVVGAVRNTEVMIPLSIDPSTGQVITLGDGLPAAFAALVDQDVMLVRAGINSSNVTAKNYAAYLPVNLGPLPVAIKRGYVAADVEVRGGEYRFVTTHPEPRSPVKEVQEAQVAELLADLSGSTRSVIVAGDMNSEPTDPAGSPYAQLAAAGYSDAWTKRIGIPAGGATCCQQADLRNEASQLNRRLDQIWIKPAAERRVGPLLITVFGDNPWERTPGGLWPSDHGGLFSGILMLPR